MRLLVVSPIAGGGISDFSHQALLSFVRFEMREVEGRGLGLYCLVAPVAIPHRHHLHTATISLIGGRSRSLRGVGILRSQSGRVS